MLLLDRRYTVILFIMSKRSTREAHIAKKKSNTLHRSVDNSITGTGLRSTQSIYKRHR